MMTNGDRGGDGRGSRLLRHAHEQGEPFDQRLRRPRSPLVGGAVRAGAGRVAHGGLHHQRNPGVGVAHHDVGAEELGSRDADDGERRTVDRQCPSHRIRRSAKLSTPVAGTDHSDRVCVERVVVSARQQPSEQGTLTQDVEVLAGHQLHRSALARRARADAVDVQLHGRNRARGGDFRLSRQVIADALHAGPRETRRGLLWMLAGHAEESIGFRDRQAPKDDRVEDGEDGG